MKYKDLFTSPEGVLAANLEPTILSERQEGFNSVWEDFIEKIAYSNDLALTWSNARINLAEMTKNASINDNFSYGQVQAIEEISAFGDLELGWFTGVKTASDTLKGGHSPEDVIAFCEEAENYEESFDLAHGFKVACNTVRLKLLAGDRDLDMLLMQGPLKTAGTDMNDFELAKYAALADMVKMAKLGASVEDAVEAIYMSLDGSNMDKVASQEESIEFRLGVEGTCYDFLKTASDYFHQYGDNEDAMIDIVNLVLHNNSDFLDKVALDLDEAMDIPSFEEDANGNVHGSIGDWVKQNQSTTIKTASFEVDNAVSEAVNQLKELGLI
jgi:hypothetical protein